MSRLIIYLWYPHLAADRLRRTCHVPADQPLVLTAKYHGADIVDAVCRLARRRGLRAGMRLADARALCPELASFDSDPAADQRDLHRLALWARRYCPLTAPDYGPEFGSHKGALTAFAGDGVWLDVAGADHLHGGIRPLLADMMRRLRQAGLAVRYAVAPTCGAAWALARYGRTGRNILVSSGSKRGVTSSPKNRTGSPTNSTKLIGAALAGLPIAALRVDSALCTAMHMAGLRVIGDIIGMPRAPLAARFSTTLIERLDAALGHINESFTPIAPLKPLITVQNFAEPVAAPDDIKAVIKHLATDIATLLETEGMAARRLRLGWQLLDGGIGVKDVHLSRPSRDIVAFHRLLAEANESINPEFGLESAWMEAHGCTLQAPVAIGFDDGILPAQQHADLVDRLVAKLGYGAVLHMKSRACWQPEAAQYMALPDVESPGFTNTAQGGTAQLGAAQLDTAQLDTAQLGTAQVPGAQLGTAQLGTAQVSTAQVPGAQVPGAQLGAAQTLNIVQTTETTETIAPRPVRLLAHPHPLSVTALLPDHPPAQFVWQKHTHKICQATGPERIAPQWWVANSGTKTRDYFRLQDDRGARFWVYREGLPERGEDTRWFLHGFFA